MSFYRFVIWDDVAVAQTWASAISNYWNIYSYQQYPSVNKQTLWPFDSICVSSHLLSPLELILKFDLVFSRSGVMLVMLAEQNPRLYNCAHLVVVTRGVLKPVTRTCMYCMRLHACDIMWYHVSLCWDMLRYVEICWDVLLLHHTCRDRRARSWASGIAAIVGCAN